MRRVLPLLTLALFAGYTAIAQDLANKIPEKALAVASIKSDQLFRLFSTGEFNTSAFGQRMAENFSKRTGGNYKSIEDAGFNLSSTIYYYYHKTDSISYNCLLIPLSDAAKFEQLFNDTTRASIKHQGETRTLATSGRNLMMWNNQMLYIAHGSTDHYFLSDSATAARYGIKQLPTEDGYDYSDEPLVDTATYAYPEIDTVATDVTEEMPEPAVDTVIESAADTLDYTEPIETEYDIAKKQQQATKDSIAAIWMEAYATDILNKSYPSILNNPSYIRSLDKNALGTFWMANLQRLYSSYLPYDLLKYGNMLKGYGSINARLYMDKEHMRITGEMALDADKADAYKKIYHKQLNKKFLKYVKSDSLIGFMSYAFDTEAYLNALPKIFSESYASYAEEIDLGSDLISLMLDEKAIAKVIKGDALILFTNISSKETTYNTYVYDENYERKDTVQTKTETLPDLLCMFSSDDTRIIEKLLKYGISKHKIRFENNIYSLNQSSKYPFSLHVVLKDGIVFLGTSLTDIEQINAGTFKGNLDKQQKDLLLNNNMTMFFSPKNLRTKMPAVELGSMSESVSNLLGNSGNWYLKSSGIKGNYVSGEFIADVPANQENALKYFFSLFNEVTKMK
jgi:hypothetical protein